MVNRRNAPTRWLLPGGRLDADPQAARRLDGIPWPQAVGPSGLDRVTLDIDLHRIPPIRPRANLRTGMWASARSTANTSVGPGERLARRAGSADPAAGPGHVIRATWAAHGVRGTPRPQPRRWQVPGVLVNKHAACLVTDQRPCRRPPARPATPRLTSRKNQWASRKNPLDRSSTIRQQSRMLPLTWEPA